MKAEILYMLAIVGAGFAVNYGLRALPFLLFAGRDRELPSWIVRFGGLISPVIIGALIVYSYSGLDWKTAWPYLAGALTVALHLWKRNPLASIVAGTVLYMCLLNCGCVSSPAIDVSRDRTEIRVVGNNAVYVGDRRVEPDAVPEMLEKSHIPHDTVIYYKADASLHRELQGAGLDRDRTSFTRESGGLAFRDLSTVNILAMILRKHGYNRAVLVSDRIADADKLTEDERRRRLELAPQPPRKTRRVRYK